MSTSRRELEAVYLDNVRSAQIGGQTDGISPEVAHDLGYQSYEETRALISNDLVESPIPAPTPPPKVVETPTRGRSNWQAASPSEAKQGQTAAEISAQIELNSKAAAAARFVLDKFSEN